jgi:hypothetical protein
MSYNLGYYDEKSSIGLAVVLCLAYSSILNYETSVAIEMTTRRYIPEDRTHNCDNLKSYNFYCYKIIINGQIGGSEQSHSLDLMETTQQSRNYNGYANGILFISAGVSKL